MWAMLALIATKLTKIKPWRWDRWNSKHNYPLVQGDPWELLKIGVDKFDKEMCDAWNGELDTVLTFVRSDVF